MSAYWKPKDTDRYTGPWNRPTSAEILVLNNRYDPATPVQGARDGAAELARARVFVTEGYGHSSMYVPSTCTEQVKRDYSAFSDRSDFICAYIGHELVGLLKIVYCEDMGAILQLMTKACHFDKNPANALIAKAVERCEEKQLPFMTYGKYRYGNQEKTSLMEFKERNGFEEIKVPRYYVPINVKGVIGMKLKLHRELVGVLPTPAIVFGRRVRSAWYKVKSPLALARAGVAQC